MSKYFRNYVQINLENIRNNCDTVRALLPKGCRLLVVLKANAYGYGIQACASACEAAADMFAVATLEEALQIRRAGVKKPILIFGPVDLDEIAVICRQALTLTVGSREYAQAVQEACAAHGQRVQYHLKIDTGLNRTGLRCRSAELDTAVKEATEILALPNLQLEGTYTHLACADSEVPDDLAFTNTQFADFQAFCDAMAQCGHSLGIRHCCSTTGILCHPEMYLDMVRTGMAALGQCVSDESRIRLGLKPALWWRARVLQIRHVPPNESISYARQYRTKRPTAVAVIAAGYADGYKQNYSNRSQILLHGHRVPVLGRICMDYLMADVTALPEVKAGDYAVLLGTDGDAEVSAMELGALNGTAPGDVTCAISARVPRVYEPARLCSSWEQVKTENSLLPAEK